LFISNNYFYKYFYLLGSFLVVYALFFAFGAVPIFIMEVTVGQYLQRGTSPLLIPPFNPYLCLISGAMEMWKMCPIFKGSKNIHSA
jgi:SNF family Na+-dependent transporter